MLDYNELVLAGENDALHCAAGHSVRELQAVGLGGGPATYYVFDGRLFKAGIEADGGVDRQAEVVTYGLQPDRLAISREHRCMPASAGEVLAYTVCLACLPVLTESAGKVLAEWHPWVQYRLWFTGNRLREHHKDRVESREDVRKRLPTALPDDGPVARAHFAAGVARGGQRR